VCGLRTDGFNERSDIDVRASHGAVAPIHGPVHIHAGGGLTWNLRRFT
jgi:hypothetical protein